MKMILKFVWEIARTAFSFMLKKRDVFVVSQAAMSAVLKAVKVQKKEK